MIEPIGIATLLLGLLCLRVGDRATAAVFVSTTLLGAAAALQIGSANIQPGHLFMGFVVLATFGQRRANGDALRSFKAPEPGFWLICLLLYGATAGFLMPRLLAGATEIVPLGASEHADTGSTVPLGPVSSNFTQAVYLAGDVVCFWLMLSMASTRAGFDTLVRAVAACALMNVLLALLDVVTGATGTQGLLEFMRNARYTLHMEEEVAGLRRIVGSFTEASAFAGATVGLVTFVGTLWLQGYRPFYTGLLTAASLALLVMSTSSTGLVGTAAVVGILYVTALWRCGVGPQRRLSTMFVVALPLIGSLVLVVLALDERVGSIVFDYVDILVLNKSTSDSGVQRTFWNVVGLQNFRDSYGLGVGLGTVRTSSFPVALLSNVGVPGTIFYLLFFLNVVARRRNRTMDPVSVARTAARNACISLTLVGFVAGPVVEQGLLFFILAGIAFAEPRSGLVRSARRVPPCETGRLRLALGLRPEMGGQRYANGHVHH